MYDQYDLAQCAGWDPYISYGLASVSWAGYVVQSADIAQTLTTAGGELDGTWYTLDRRIDRRIDR